MKQIFTHYIVQKEKIDKNIQAIKDLLEELRVQKIKDTRYSVYKMGENAFIHIAHFRNEKANNIFLDLPEFKKFPKCLQVCLEEKPIVMDVDEIGTYSDYNSPRRS